MRGGERHPGQIRRSQNWIGPAGRISIGLVAGIAIVIWSERFRVKDYKAFSYSLKAVGIGIALAMGALLVTMTLEGSSPMAASSG